MFSTTPDLSQPKDHLSHFKVSISHSSQMFLYLLWAGCLCIALIYSIDHAFVWLVLVLYAICCWAYVCVNKRMTQISGLGYDGTLYLLMDGVKVPIKECHDVRVFPFCVLAIVKLDQHKTGLIERLLFRSIALNLNRKNMSEADFHKVRRHFSLA